MANLLWIASGGAIGALLRYGVVSMVYRMAGAGFPYGTLTANLTGSLMIGVLWSVAERTQMNPSASAFLFIGVLGAFTTFSTFAIESVELMRDGRLAAAAAYVLASNVSCLLAAMGGLVIGRQLPGV